MTPNPSFKVTVYYKGEYLANAPYMEPRVFGVGGSNCAICGLIKYKMAADDYLGCTENGHNLATGLPVDMMFGSRMGFPVELRFYR